MKDYPDSVNRIHAQVLEANQGKPNPNDVNMKNEIGKQPVVADSTFDNIKKPQ